MAPLVRRAPPHPLPLLRRLSIPLLAFLLVFLTPGPGSGAQEPHSPATGTQGDPGEVILRALRSMEGEEEDARREWERRLRADPQDREAALGLAALDGLEYRQAEARARIDGLLAPGQPTDEVTPFAWLTLGEAAQMRGAYGEAARILQSGLEAAQAVGSRRAEAWIRTRWAGVLGRVAGLGPMQAQLAAAEPLLDESDPYVRGLFHCTRAGMDPERRLTPPEDLELGTTLAREAGVRRLEAACGLTLASFRINRGETGAALSLLHEVQGIQAAVGDLAGRSVSLQHAGYTYVTLGHYGWAQSYLEQAIADGNASGNASAVAWSLLSLSTISWGLGDLAAAIEYNRQGEALLREQADSVGLGVAEGQKGDLAFAAGDYAAARAHWMEALARYRERGSLKDEMGVQAALMRLAVAEGDLEAAEERLARAREVGEAGGMDPWVSSLLYDEGEIALRKGELARAERSFREVASRSQTPLRAFKVRARLAEVLALTGRAGEAEEQLTAAIAGIEAWRGSLDASGLRRYAFQVAENVPDPDMGVATVLSVLAEGGRGQAAFDLAERQRARSLFEAMTRADAARSLSLARPLAEVDDPLQAPAPRSARGVLSALPDDGLAILEFVVGLGGEPTTVFVLTGGAMRSYRLLPVDSLRSAAERLIAGLAAGREPGPEATRLGEALLQAAVDGLPPSVDRLAIVPDGVLHRLPWDVLVLKEGARVVERFSVSLAPSATVLAELWERPTRPAASSLLALADPALPRDGMGTGESAGSRGSLQELRRELPPLPGSAREARLAARFAEEARVLTGPDASEGFLKSTPLEPFRVLHFATHALVDESTVARTALVLSPSGEEDGLVSPGDLARLRLQAELVVLSACRTAGGSVIRGEGIQGLTGPLLEAGARAVLATGWEIEDREGRRFVEDLYGGMADGLTVGEALRRAKLRAADRGEPPSQWAAFSLVGDPDVRVTLRKAWTPTVGGWASAVALALALGAALLGLRRRRGVESE